MTISLLDFCVAAISLVIAFHLRVDSQRAAEFLQAFPLAVPLFAGVACIIFPLLGLQQRVWRYTSIADILVVIEAATLSIGLYLALLMALDRFDWMPGSIPIIQWFVLVVLLGGMRMTRRLVAEYLNGTVLPPAPALPPARPARPALLVGTSDRVELLLRHLECKRDCGFRPVGILDDMAPHASVRVRGVPILGSAGELQQVVDRLTAEGRRPECLLFADAVERFRGASMVRVVAEAQILALDVAYLPGLAEYDPAANATLDFRYMNIADLLGRPQTELDAKVVAGTIAGRCVLVTGAGGTIGRELVRQIAACGPAKLLLLDANEFNLYEVDLELRENHPEVPRVPVLCSIRQRWQVMQVFAEHRPELVFHAAALKHVPLVEGHPSASIQTNVLGTRNIADAVRRHGARAMIQVSTDKAVNPVGFMGVTKRLGELYCQALDLEGQDNETAPRFMTVRFGNVLGSSGSLIPLFQRQLSRGGPLTVTHAEIERFFMTVHEAVHLILHSASCSLRGGMRRGRIFVLDMGEPIRVMDIARRMIRLAGFEPGVDVGIDIIGLRPGEKLFEELFDTEEQRLPSALPGIFEAEPKPVPLSVLNKAFDALEMASEVGDDATCRDIAGRVLAYRHESRTQDIAFERPAAAASCAPLATGLVAQAN